MSLAPHTRFGPYILAESIGVGGMGEVYRATDTNLKRDVAIKVLPESFAADADRLARFQREAEVLAALNHVNIAHIYGLERSGAVTALVMELVDGQTLAERLEQGALPTEEALNIAMQIAEALEAAHERGIVHRDLKPANIKLASNGLVKVLDFGIAKAVDPALHASGPVAAQLTTPAMTESGMILGTAAYMSPEQARGKAVDRRTDIWAFGCVLYEMLMGQPVFIGEDVMVVMARILRDDVDLRSLPASTTPALRQTIRLCLEKDPKKRLHHIGDVRLALVGSLETAAPPAPAAQRSSPWQFWRKALPLAVGLATLGSFLTLQFRPEAAPPSVMRFEHDLPPFRSVAGTSMLDIAPNGRRLVYNSSDGLVIRDLDTLEDRVIPNTETRSGVEFSPDGEWLAFFRPDGAGAALVRMAITGGPEVELARWPTQRGAGISWEADGTLLAGRAGEGIFRLSENGGELERLVTLQPSESLGSPQLLPGGEWIMFESGSGNYPDLLAQSLVTGERKQLQAFVSEARYVPSGHLLYQKNGILFAVAFDPASAEVSGTPVPVVQGVGAGSGGLNVKPYAVTDNGTLVYVPAPEPGNEASTLGLGDGNGNGQALALPPGTYNNPRGSADGRWLAYQAQYNDGADIAVVELGSAAAPRRLTFGGNNTRPAWSADGTRIAYWSAREDGPGLYWRLSDGSGTEERLTEAAAGEAHLADHFSPDGQHLAYSVTANGTSTIWLLELETRKASLLVESPSPGASHAVFAPDGRSLAYQAHDTGDNELFVQPFPPTGAKYQLPPRGDNHHPAWSPDGRQIYYVPGPGRFERVDISTERGIGFGSPVILNLAPVLDGPPIGPRGYDLMPDGSILGVMSENRQLEFDRSRLIIVQNWFEELSRLVPVE